MLQLEDTVRIHLKQNNQLYLMKTSVSFTKLDMYFFNFLAVFVAPNLEAITKNRFNYGVK